MDTATRLTVKHLDHLNMSVADLDETAAWYARVFGFQQVERGVSQGTPYAVLRSGEALLCVYHRPDRERISAEHRRGRRVHGVSHFALRITDRAAWEETVAREGLELEFGGAVGWDHSTAWYLTDPSGYMIEVALWEGDQVDFQGAPGSTDHELVPRS